MANIGGVNIGEHSLSSSKKLVVFDIIKILGNQLTFANALPIQYFITYGIQAGINILVSA